MCFQSDSTFIKKEFMGKMNINLYKKIIDEAHDNGTCAITFGSRGEPTIHPQFIEFLDYLKEKFLDVKLITNATKLSDKLIHKIFSSKISTLPPVNFIPNKREGITLVLFKTSRSFFNRISGSSENTLSSKLSL